MALISINTLFVVVSDPENAGLGVTIAQTFPEDYLLLRPGQWLIAASGTAREISDKIGLTPSGTTGSGIVLAVSGYYGRGSTQIWEWIAAKIGKPANA
jgi:hypothetical protein